MVLALLSLPLPAQRMPGNTEAAHPYVQAAGELTIEAKPDQAEIDIGVVTQAPNASAAASQNAAQVSAVLAELRKLLGSAGSIQTRNYSVSPSYSYPKNGPATISGYVATNVVEATVNDLAQVGKLIDAATQSGANNIQRLQFTLKNDQEIRARALREAAAQAKANAEAMAGGLGLKLGRVLALEQGEAASPAPIVSTLFKSAAAAPTPVEAGNIQVHATVTVRMEIGQ
jgi:uncharacterized protein YggE